MKYPRISAGVVVGRTLDGRAFVVPEDHVDKRWSEVVMLTLPTFEERDMLEGKS